MAIDRDAMQKEVQDAKERRAQGSIRWLKKDATTNLRVIEFPDENGKTIFARAYARFNYPGGKKSMIDRQRTFGLPCAATRVSDLSDEGRMESPFDKRRTTYLVKAIDVDKKPHQIETFEIPTTVWEAIAEHALTDEWADVLEPDKGHVFSITKSGSGLDTEYKVVVGRAPWPVGAKLLEGLTDPISDLPDPGVEGQCKELGVEPTELWGNFDEMDGVQPFVLTPGKKSPTKKPSKAAPAAASEPAPSPAGKTSKKVSKKAATRDSKFKVGDRGEALFNDGEWYACEIVAVTAAGLDVRADDGDEWEVNEAGFRQPGTKSKTVDTRPAAGSHGMGVFPDDGEKYPCKVLTLVGTAELKVEWDDGSDPSVIDAADFEVDDIPFEVAPEDDEDDILPGATAAADDMI